VIAIRDGVIGKNIEIRFVFAYTAFEQPCGQWKLIWAQFSEDATHHSQADCEYHRLRISDG